MCSGMGQNVQFYCERFGITLHDAVTIGKEVNLEDDRDGLASMHHKGAKGAGYGDRVCCLSSDEFARDDVYSVCADFLPISFEIFFFLSICIFPFCFIIYVPHLLFILIIIIILLKI